MLAKCLLSISPRRQHRVGDAEVCYVVVDNSDKPSGAVHKAVDKILPAGSRYVVCPKPGLANARNAAIAHALAMDASWIAFIDDDEEAADDWLFSLYWSARRYNADACHGVVRYRFPSDAPAWRRRNPWGDWADHDGAELSSAGTGNVIFRADIVRRARLSFCPSLNGMGGEDGKFFRTYHDLGGKIVFSSAPRVVENVPWSRITVRGFARKSHRNGALTVENARIGGHSPPWRVKASPSCRRALTTSPSPRALSVECSECSRTITQQRTATNRSKLIGDCNASSTYMRADGPAIGVSIRRQ
jgi:succinoglycan biosynthesis protein ExoM